MNNELIKTIENKISTINEEVSRYKIVLDSFISRKDSLSKKELNQAYTIQETYNSKIDELTTMKNDLDMYKKASESERERIESTLSAKYLQKDKKITEFDNPKESNKGKVVKGFICGLSVVVALGMIHHIGKEIVNNQTKEPTTSSMPLDEQDDLQTASLLKPGEYGTFLDINDEKQLEDRVNYIDEKNQAEIKTLKEELAKNGTTSALLYEKYTKEDKKEMLKVLLGLKPVDSSDLDYYSMMAMELGINMTNHPISKGSENWNSVYMSLYFPDNSKAAELMREVETAYNKLAEAAKSGNRELTLQYGKEFNSLYINIMNYQGLYLPMGIEGNGNYESPLSIANIETEYKYFASFLIRGLKAPITEMSDKYDDGFCAPGCIDTKTGKEKLWTFEKTIREFDKGMPNQEELRTTGKVVREECLITQYYEQMLKSYREELGYSYKLD